MAAVVSNPGYCVVCEDETRFTAEDAWLRDHYRCERCGSIPRERALVLVLGRRYPTWRNLDIHESSPGLPSSHFLSRECSGYVISQFYPGLPPGDMSRGTRNENLTHQSFPDASFDVVITQDVMEHVFDHEAAFREIGRTLRPGGAHVFTTPVYPGLPKTEVCARIGEDGGVEHFTEPEYHHNPVDPGGSLVTVKWGQDIGEIAAAGGLVTTIHTIVDRRFGLDGEFLEVMVSRKPGS